MAEGLSTTSWNAVLDAILGGSIYSTPFVQLHTGAPGASGTSNVASNSTRVAVTAASASGASKASNAAVTWITVPTTETYAKFSVFSASSSGTFIFSGSITGGSVTAGDTFQIPSGSLTVSGTAAS